MIARAKVFEQMKLIAAAGISDEGLRKEHGGTGDVGAAQEFVIDSPTPTARKDYIGSAAETASVAAIFAQLITIKDPRPRPAGKPAKQIRQRRSGRHLQLTDRQPEPPVLHHDRHVDPWTGHGRRRRLPLIARSYALQFAQNELVSRCHKLQTSDVTDADEQRELEARAI